MIGDSASVIRKMLAQLSHSLILFSSTTLVFGTEQSQGADVHSDWYELVSKNIPPTSSRHQLEMLLYKYYHQFMHAGIEFLLPISWTYGRFASYAGRASIQLSVLSRSLIYSSDHLWLVQFFFQEVLSLRLCRETKQFGIRLIQDKLQKLTVRAYFLFYSTRNNSQQ